MGHPDDGGSTGVHVEELSQVRLTPVTVIAGMMRGGWMGSGAVTVGGTTGA